MPTPVLGEAGVVGESFGANEQGLLLGGGQELGQGRVLARGPG